MEFQYILKFLDHFPPSFLSQKCQFEDSSPLCDHIVFYFNFSDQTPKIIAQASAGFSFEATASEAGGADLKPSNSGNVSKGHENIFCF